jgi:hypothetical protein
MKKWYLDPLTIVLIIILIIFILIAVGFLKIPEIIKILGGILGK